MLNLLPLGGIVLVVEKDHEGCHAQYGYTSDKQAYLRRLRLIEGQTRGIARMMEQDEYCIDIMTQISAVTSALKAVSMALLKDHLEHCVAAAVREGGDAAQEKFDEAMTAISRLARGGPPRRFIVNPLPAGSGESAGPCGQARIQKGKP